MKPSVAEGRRPSVLVVEDDEPLRLLLRTLLEKNGFEIECVPDGAQAVEKILTGRFDAIVLDLMMPEVSGFDVLEQLKRISPATLDRTIVTTGVNEKLVRRASDVTVYRLLRKPFDINEFVSTVSSCVKQKRPAGGSTAPELSSAAELELIRSSVWNRFAARVPELKKTLRGRASGPDEVLLRSELRETISELGTLMQVLGTVDHDTDRSAEFLRIAEAAKEVTRLPLSRGERGRSH